jgi:hypothetical protein
LALGKTVFASSNFRGDTSEGWQNAVDGRTRVATIDLLFHTGFELYPWLTITLGKLSVVKSVTLYNRIHGNGKTFILIQNYLNYLRIWCIKIGIVIVLHFNPWVEASAGRKRRIISFMLQWIWLKFMAQYLGFFGSFTLFTMFFGFPTFLA